MRMRGMDGCGLGEAGEFPGTMRSKGKSGLWICSGNTRPESVIRVREHEAKTQ